MSATEVLSEEEEDGDTSARGDDVDEDKEGSDAISFVMQDCFFLRRAIAFCQFHLCVVIVH